MLFSLVLYLYSRYQGFSQSDKTVPLLSENKSSDQRMKIISPLVFMFRNYAKFALTETFSLDIFYRTFGEN